MSNRKALFNPLGKRELAESVVSALLAQEPVLLKQLEPFPGAGIYSLYYSGDHPAYQRLTQSHLRAAFSVPVYVGKAVPAGSRKGGLFDAVHGSVLYQRLSKHRQTISDAENLELSDFHCRYLVVDEIWIPLGESLLISKFGPVWNSLLDGFGNNDPGAGRHQGLCPRWDMLHPGRGWARRLQPRAETSAQLAIEVDNYLLNTL